MQSLLVGQAPAVTSLPKKQANTSPSSEHRPKQAGNRKCARLREAGEPRSILPAPRPADMTAPRAALAFALGLVHARLGKRPPAGKEDRKGLWVPAATGLCRGGSRPEHRILFVKKVLKISCRAGLGVQGGSRCLRSGQIAPQPSLDPNLLRGGWIPVIYQL